jgi:hypothetical protein
MSVPYATAATPVRVIGHGETDGLQESA